MTANKFGSRLDRRHFMLGAATTGLGLAGLATTGCGDDDDDGASPGSSPEPSRTTANGDFDPTARLRIAYPSFPGTLDPQALGGFAGQSAANIINFVGPFAMGDSLNAVNGGIADWEYVDNNRAIQLTVRQGLQFHNGEPIDAAQIKFNVDRVLGRAAYNPDFVSQNGPILKDIGDVTALDDMRLRIEMTKPSPQIVNSLGIYLLLVPQGYVTEKGDEEFARNPVGAGPFQFVSWVPDQSMRSMRFDGYSIPRDRNTIQPRLPYVAEQLSTLVPEEQSRLAALQTGETDVAVNISSDNAKQFEGKEGYSVFYHSAARGLHFQLPLYRSLDSKTGGPNPWRDKRVRLAANLALDIDAITSALLTGKESRTYPLAVGQLGFPERLMQSTYKSDPAKAKALLDEAGAAGFEFDLNYPRGLYTNDGQWTEALAGMLREVGFKVNVVANDATKYFADVTAHKFNQPFLYPQFAGQDPISSLLATLLSDGSNTIPADPGELTTTGREIDDLIRQAAAEFDTEKQRATLEQIATKSYEDASWIYLFELIQSHVTRDTVKWDIFATKPISPETWNMRVANG